MDGVTLSESWLGDGTAQANARDVSRGLYLTGIACLINAAWVAALSVVRLV